MTFETFVSRRYLRAKRKGWFTLLTTFIGIGGVMVGVAALIATLSVMNGFQTDIQKKIIGAQAHLMVYGELDEARLKRLEDELARHPEIRATARFALGQAIMTYRDRSFGVLLRGLEPAAEFKVNDLEKTLQQGSWRSIQRRLPAAKDPPAIILGQELARNLGLWMGDEVVLVSPKAENAVGMIPRMKRFKVAGLIKTGYYEYDAATAYTHLSEAAAFFDLPAGAGGVEARLARMDQADDVAARLRKALGLSYVVQSFQDLNKPLFAALKLEKFVMALLLALISVVAAFNIASNLLLMGKEKLRDIGLLKAMGASPKQVMKIFVWEGLWIGVWGVGLGIALGLAICFIIHRYPPIELPGDIYYLSRVPVDVQWTDLGMTVVFGFLLSLLATVYPALRASEADPVEAIRYG